MQEPAKEEAATEEVYMGWGMWGRKGRRSNALLDVGICGGGTVR